MHETTNPRPIDCLLIDDAPPDYAPAEIELRCICGSCEFEMHYPGADQVSSDECAESAGRSEFSAQAVCAVCARVYRIFSLGYQPVESGDSIPGQYAPWSCPSCAGLAHRVTTGIVCLDQPGAGRPSGIKWLTIHSTCGRCGKEYGRWISLELPLPL